MAQDARAQAQAGETVPLARQIACVARELRLRRTVYPRQVELNRMTREEAAREIGCMEAVLASLRELAGLPSPAQPDLPYPAELDGGGRRG